MITRAEPRDGGRRVAAETGGFEILAADRRVRLTALAVLMVDLAWFVYTHLYFWLHPRGMTVAPSLFMHLTGRPDPFCGLTRTFAWMWRGDVGRAVMVYPLGPAVFVGSLMVAGYALLVLISGRRLRRRVRPTQVRAMLMVAAVALAINWMLKLAWLGV